MSYILDLLCSAIIIKMKHLHNDVYTSYINMLQIIFLVDQPINITNNIIITIRF